MRSRDQGALDAPILSQGSISRAAPKYRRYIGAGRKRRCVKRKAHRPHTEALGSSAQMRCVSCRYPDAQTSDADELAGCQRSKEPLAFGRQMQMP
jgi:hypothetical protein